ncbi:MAG: glycogen synthase GlgA [Thiohalomonadaceae bacterium]
MSKILFVSSEAHPLIKTGGLGDVSGSLPAALKRLHHTVRLVLPAYQEAVAKAGKLKTIATLRVADRLEPVRILEGLMPGTRVKLWLVDAPGCFDRPGNPYLGEDGRDWPDNAQRFATFCRAVVELAMDRAGLRWRPDVVHCNDWQTGLVPALLAREQQRPGTVFTIHNLAYQGLFPWNSFAALGLPAELWHMHAMEFHNQFSFIKGGLVFADWITTVSPTYAREICGPDLGYGLDGLLRHRSDRLTGILNGADYDIWNPRTDKLIAHTYSPATLHHKRANKAALQAQFNLPVDSDSPLLGLVGRMVEQKGIDLVLGALPVLVKQGVQVAVLGTGDLAYENELCALANRHPEAIGYHIGYDEARAHLVEAGADMFLMPSRFEPCGLNQIYSLHYGTPPIVRRTGGLADTVVDATPETLADGSATGFVFDDATPEALVTAVERALTLYRQPKVWKRLMTAAMDQDFSWQASARRYLEIYTRARNHARTV